MEIEITKILQGHNSPETAFVVEDYPYGYTLRCQMRHWIEVATKGAKKGQMRHVTQTSNPKKLGVWNKPKAGTYYPLIVLYLDAEDHVKPLYLDPCSSPQKFQPFWDNIGELTERQRKLVEEFELIGRKPGINAHSWWEWDVETGKIPTDTPPPENPWRIHSVESVSLNLT